MQSPLPSKYGCYHAQVRNRWVWAAAVLSLTLAELQIADLPTPEAHFGFRMGAEGQLASADAIEKYFELVASGSDRVEIT